tara:strand:+ start:496 stop:1533 length:1038 start_codon:yes stop_codon:yes gene_type:complete
MPDQEDYELEAQQTCEEGGGTWTPGHPTYGGGSCAYPNEDTETGMSEWGFEGVDFEDVTVDVGEDGVQFGLTDDFMDWDIDTPHTLAGSGPGSIMHWIGEQGFQGTTEASTIYENIDWFVEQWGSLGGTLAFDPSGIEDITEGANLGASALMGEISEWEKGQRDILYGTDDTVGAIENIQTLAQQQLEAFSLAEQERQVMQRKSTADLRRQALQGIAATRRTSAGRGLASGMSGGRDLDTFLTASRETSIGAREARKDYLSNISATETQRDFNVAQAETTFMNELEAKELAASNELTQMTYDYRADVEAEYEDWYSNLINTISTQFPVGDTVSEAGDTFNPFGVI